MATKQSGSPATPGSQTPETDTQLDGPVAIDHLKVEQGNLLAGLTVGSLSVAVYAPSDDVSLAALQTVLAPDVATRLFEGHATRQAATIADANGDPGAGGDANATSDPGAGGDANATSDAHADAGDGDPSATPPRDDGGGDDPADGATAGDERGPKYRANIDAEDPLAGRGPSGSPRGDHA